MTTLSGVVQTEVGPRYDLAIGYDSGAGTATMVGYVLAQGQRLEESTDIQDNQRLIQIASPNSTDRFTFYPKATQSNWVGGERQIIFVDPNRYYQSQKLETSQEGHLYIAGYYLASSALANYTPGSGRSIGPDPITVIWLWGINNSGVTGNVVKIIENAITAAPTIVLGTVGAVADTVQEILQAPSDLYGYVTGATNPGFYSIPGSSRKSTNTDVNPGGVEMAYYNNAVYYMNNSAPNTIQSLTNLGAGGITSATATTLLNMEADTGGQTGLHYLGSTPTGLFFLTSGAALPVKAYAFDGVTTTLLGEIKANIVDIVQAAGVTFILCGAKLAVNGVQVPVIYSYYSGQLSVFDDFRFLPPAFLPPLATTSGANLFTDGTFLYMTFSGLNTKRYDLRSFPSVVVSDIGNPTATNTADSRSGTINPFSNRIYETNSATNKVYALHPTGGAAAITNDTGYLITSYFDMGAPATTKAFRSFEVELNAVMVAGATVTVKYNLDNQTGFANSLTMQTLGTNNLIGYFPASTLAYRVQLKITLTSGNSNGASPDIRSYSVNGRLGRVWKATLQARRQMTLHDGSVDAQGNAVALPNAQNLLGNIVNCYQKAAGNAILFIPDSTSSTGVTQVNAVLEDYQISTPKPGPVGSEQSVPDMEADVTCTFVERL